MPWQALPARTPGRWRIVKDNREGLKEYSTKEAAERDAERRNATEAEMERWAQTVKL
jgi:hypothetical protein